MAHNVYLLSYIVSPSKTWLKSVVFIVSYDYI